MASIRDNAIVLRRLDYSETSQVLAFFTREHGQRRLIAKGIKKGTKKKFASGIDLLEQGELVFWQSAQSESGLATLTEWRQTDLFLGLRDSLDRWYAGQYAAQITTGMTQENDPHAEVFDGLSRTLFGLASGEPVLERLLWYQRLVLESAGLWPDLSRCVVCGRAAPPGRAAYFSAQQGGLVCRQCEGPLIEKRLVAAVVLNRMRGEDSASDHQREVFDLLDYTIGYAIGRRLSLGAAVLASSSRQ